MQDLERARRSIVELAPAAAEAIARLDDARQRHDRFSMIAALLRTGFSIDPGPSAEGISPKDAIEGKLGSLPHFPSSQ